MRMNPDHARTINRLRENMERMRAWEEWLSLLPDADALERAARAAGGSGDVLVGEYLEDWLGRRTSVLRPTTQRSYRGMIRCYLVPRIGQLTIRELDRIRIEDLYAELLRSGGHNGRPLAPTTVQHCHAILSRALEDAVLNGLIARNHARSVRPPQRRHDQREVEEQLRVWTAEEARRFLVAIDDHPWRAIWHLGLGTGLRRGEILGLRWCDVDLEARVIRVSRALTYVEGDFRLLSPKTCRQRAISLGSSVVRTLGHWRDEQEAWRTSGPRWLNEWDLVFTQPDGSPIDPMLVTREFRKVVRGAGVPVIRLHDLRHTHATLMLAADVPIRIVSDRLGHVTVAVTMDIYGHLLPGMDAEAAAKFDAMLTN